MTRLSTALFSIALLSFCTGCGTSQSNEPTSPNTPGQVQHSPNSNSSSSSQESTGSFVGSGGGRTSSGKGGENSGSGGRGTTGGRTTAESEQTPGEWQQKNFKPRPFKHFKHMDGYSQVARMQSQPTSPTNRKSGKELFKQACVYCHGLDGKPLRTDPSLTRYNMADLSRPHLYKYGSTSKALYRSIAFGVPAPPMGHFKEVYNKQQIWDLVNYIQSLQRK